MSAPFVGLQETSAREPLKRFCPECEWSTRDIEVSFCTQCGTELPEVMVTSAKEVVYRCADCDYPRQGIRDKFCGRCGGEIEEVTIENKTPVTEHVHRNRQGQEYDPLEGLPAELLVEMKNPI